MYLSGNQITGSLPDNVQVSPSLQDISLSYNILTGKIPLWLQERSWTLLDLSNNKLTGEISNSISAVPSDGYFALDVNRLSGTIPHSLLHADNISVLTDNIYACKLDKSNLPENDNNRWNYSCGTLAIDVSIFLWIGGFLILVCIRSWLMSWFAKYSLFSDSEERLIRNSEISPNKTCRDRLLRQYNLIVPYVSDILQKVLDDWVLFKSTDNHQQLSANNGIRLMILFYSSVRYIFCVITLLTVFFLMPMYGILSIWYSMYEASYAWSISAILFTGEIASALLLIGFSLCTILVFYVFYKKAYPFSARRKIDYARAIMNADKSSVIKIQPTDIRLTVKEKSIYWLTTSILGSLNFIIMILVDVFYVLAILEANTSHTIEIQILLSIFKVIWNENVLWSVFPQIKNFATILLHGDNSESNHEINIETNQRNNCCRTWINAFRGLIQLVPLAQFNSAEINFMALTVVLNNIVIPCIAIAVVSPHCFYNAFFAQSPSETISIFTCQFYSIREESSHIKRACLVYSNYAYEASYNAPFHYRYECSAAFSIKFVSVYIFMFLIVAVILPLLQTILRLIYHAYEPKPGQEVTDNRWTSYLFKLADRFLPFRLKTLTAQPPSDMVKVLANDRLIVRCSSYLAVLLAFGVLFPPLSVVALISIYAITYFEQFVLSKVLVESKRLGYTWYQEKILKECDNIAESWFDTLKIILPFASFSFAFVVFDTLGDKHGWKTAIGPSLFVLTLPVWFYVWRWCRSKAKVDVGSSAYDFVYEDIFMDNLLDCFTSVSNDGKEIGRSRSVVVEMRLSALHGGLLDEQYIVENPVHNHDLDNEEDDGDDDTSSVTY
jgi:hypothetical protein